MTETEAVASEKPKRRRRRALIWTGAGVAVLLLVPVIAVAVVFWMAIDTMVRLPEAVQSRIEARLDEAMIANRIEVADMGVALRDGGVTPQIVLSDVEMWEGDEIRAAFPEVSVLLNGRALLRGEMRPYSVRLTGAGVRLSRDADGQFDLALAADDATAADRGLEETLARIDAMFANPVFELLQEISGTELEVILDDQMTGDQVHAYGASMQLERKGRALTFTIGGQVDGTRAAEFSMAVTRNADLERTDMRMQFQDFAARDVATAAPALAWLDLMRAPISGALTTRLSDDGAIGDLSAVLEIGAGQISLGEGVASLPFEELSAHFDYDAETALLSFAELTVDAPALSFSGDGHATLDPDATSYVGQFSFSSITADPVGMFDAPISFEGGAVDMRLSLAPQVRLELGQVVLFDGPLHLRGAGEFAATLDGLLSRFDVTIPEIAARDVLPYWPSEAIPNTRTWLDRNLTAGQLRDVHFALRRAPGEAPLQNLRLDFTETTLQALRHMPPIEGGAGYLSIMGSRFVMALNEGQVTPEAGDPVDLAGSVMIIEDLRIRGPDSQFDLHVAGAVPDVMRLLRLPPINLMAESARDPVTLATGEARLRGALSLPLRRQVPFEEISFDVTGHIDDVRSETLVPGREVRAERLQLAVDTSQAVISGRASLDGVPATARWSRALGPDVPDLSLLEGTTALSSDSLAAFGVALPGGLLSGSASADFQMEIGGEGAPELSITSDLSGLGLTIDALGWRKPASQVGAMSARVQLGETPSLPELRLNASGLDLDGAVSLREGGGFGRLSANRLQVGSWLDVQGALVGRGAGRAPEIEVSGGVVDLRNLPSGGNAGGGGDAGPLNIRLDRVQVTEGIALTELRAELTTPGGLSGQFRGNVNGGPPVAGTLVTTAQGAAVRLRADDGGAVLRAAGLYENAYGGEMQLLLQPTEGAGNYSGQLTIMSPRLRNAPAMAELLNVISVVGLLEQLGGDGINLGEVEARFRLTPRAVVIDQGTAVGPSMGISMDGLYDIANRRFDMQGVVSPLYLVNGVIGALFAPRREGLFGFSYRLTGTPENTNVSVNPLSILTPGIFREIFRRPPPELSQ